MAKLQSLLLLAISLLLALVPLTNALDDITGDALVADVGEDLEDDVNPSLGSAMRSLLGRRSKKGKGRGKDKHKGRGRKGYGYGYGRCGKKGQKCCDYHKCHGKHLECKEGYCVDYYKCDPHHCERKHPSGPCERSVCRDYRCEKEKKKDGTKCRLDYGKRHGKCKYGECVPTCDPHKCRGGDDCNKKECRDHDCVHTKLTGNKCRLRYGYYKYGRCHHGECVSKGHGGHKKRGGGGKHKGRGKGKGKGKGKGRKHGRKGKGKKRGRGRN